jgi:hypothetical protein
MKVYLFCIQSVSELLIIVLLDLSVDYFITQLLKLYNGQRNRSVRTAFYDMQNTEIHAILCMHCHEMLTYILLDHSNTPWQM